MKVSSAKDISFSDLATSYGIAPYTLMGYAFLSRKAPDFLD
jgi:hypothetical protein